MCEALIVMGKLRFSNITCFGETLAGFRAFPIRPGFYEVGAEWKYVRIDQSYLLKSNSSLSCDCWNFASLRITQFWSPPIYSLKEAIFVLIYCFEL